MKIAFFVEDGLEQIVLTPESKVEGDMLGKLHDGTRELSVVKGSFYDCRGGWKRYTPHDQTYGMFGASERGDESTMIVLRPAQVDRSPEGQDGETRLDRNDESAVPEGNAHNKDRS
jgi:hypothetical protein